MISAEKAAKIILNDIGICQTEKIPITISYLRVIASDVTAKRDVPSFDNSAMDGYAVKYQDTKSAGKNDIISLKVTAEAKAGAAYKGIVRSGCAVKIMTGAVIPKGADSVVMIEQVKEKSGYIYIKDPVKRAQHVRSAGEDVRKGELIIKKGKRLSPADIGILASQRIRKVNVYKKPVVALLCTGSELIDIDDDYKHGKIVASNLYSLTALVSASRGVVVNLGISKDDKSAIKRKIKSGLKYDYLITSGGISVGDYDYIDEVLLELGANRKIRKVAIRPGKPFSYYTIGNTKIFALPGNPVSSMVSFLLFVRPAIIKMSGISGKYYKKTEAVLGKDIIKGKGYQHFIRGIISKRKGAYYVKPTGPQGSGILQSMSLANGLIVVNASCEKIEKGETVKVIIIDDSFDSTGMI